MAPKKSSSSSRKGSSCEVSYTHAVRGGSLDAARSRLPPNINWEKLSPEKQKNCERAFTAASRRSDRDIDARYQSALTASDMHFLRTGKYLRVTREMVMNEEMYEEEDSHPRLWTSNLRQDSDPRMAALNQQYQNIDLQFQAAFPGFGSRGPAGMSPATATAGIPYAAGVVPTAPQFEQVRYGTQHGYMPQSYTPLSYSSDEPSPPPMSDSASASPMVGIATPSSVGLGYPLPTTASPEMMSLPDMAYTSAKMEPGYAFDDATGFEPVADSTAMWGAGVGEEFSEFVNYQ